MTVTSHTIGGWVIERQLGQGATAQVFLCHHPESERIRAAVKVLSLTSAKDSNARFIREAEILSRVRHPNVVRMGGLRTDADPPFLIMDYVEGVDIESWVKDERSLLERVRVCRRIADAVASLHAQGIRHRDLKPHNICVRTDNEPVLLDFGIAIDEEATRLTDAELLPPATVEYAPPEWMDGQLDEAAWDAYSLGVLIAEVMTGERVYKRDGVGRTNDQIFRLMLKKRSDGAVRIDVGPREIGDIVRVLTQAEPDQRQTDLQVVADQLARVEEGLVGPKRRPSRSVIEIASWAMASAGVALMVAALLVGLLLAAIVLWG